MNRLVDRYGRTGFAALTSVVWALPMAAWAGSFDLSPIDQTAYPWIALTIGVVLLIAWLLLLVRVSRVPVTPRVHRLDFRQMSSTEKRWSLAALAFGVGVIAWLNTAATVDLGPLAAAVAAGKPAPTLFAVVAGILLLALLAGTALSWRRATKAFALRRSRPPATERS